MFCPRQTLVTIRWGINLLPFASLGTTSSSTLTSGEGETVRKTWLPSPPCIFRPSVNPVRDSLVVACVSYLFFLAKNAVAMAGLHFLKVVVRQAYTVRW